MSQIVTSGATSARPLIEWLQSEEGQAKQPKTPSRTSGLTVSQIIEDYHVGYPRIDEAIRNGDLRAQVVFEKRGGTPGAIKYIRASRDDAKRLFVVGSQGAPAAPDLESITKLARDFGVSRNTILEWCSWKNHPALCDVRHPHGRQIRHENRDNSVETANGQTRVYHDSPMASRSDVEKCVEMVKQNPIGERFGDNPGVWAYVDTPRGKLGSKNQAKKKKRYPGLKGSFQHDDGEILLTGAAFIAKYDLPLSALSKRCYLERLRIIRVILPGVRGEGAIKPSKAFAIARRACAIERKACGNCEIEVEGSFERAFAGVRPLVRKAVEKFGFQALYNLPKNAIDTARAKFVGIYKELVELEPDGAEGWRVPVYGQKSGEILKELRKGRTKEGHWLVPNRIWNELAGEYKGIIYTNDHVLETLKEYGVTLESYQLNNWCEQELLTKYKNLPRAVENGRKHGSKLRGFHCSEIDPLFLQAKNGQPLSPKPVEAGAGQQPIDGGNGSTAVVLGDFGEPVFVNGVEKSIAFFGAYKIVKALVPAGRLGLSKDQLEKVNSAGRRILKTLAKDPDWKTVIHFPSVRGQRYRIY
jgi:hypothetical protein